MSNPRVAPSSGVSFKAQHFNAIIDGGHGEATWFEVHPENYMVAGGLRLEQLEKLRANFPLSMHGVGLSLGGGGEPLNPSHLGAFKSLIERFEPILVSEHIAWSSHQGLYLADLLPIPLTPSALTGLVEAIDYTQEFLHRRILIENPSNYLSFPEDVIPELEFITDAAKRSGCGLLIDINNIYVSAHNLGFDPVDYIDGILGDLVGEVHLAGHSLDTTNSRDALLIDTHGSEVSQPVWALYERLIQRIGEKPTLVEWDNDIPSWEILSKQARFAASILKNEKKARARSAS